MEKRVSSSSKPSLFIESKGFCLRPFQQSDASSLWHAVQETRPHLQRWNHLGDQDRSIEQVHHRIASWTEAFSSRRRLQYGLIGEDRTVLGGAALEQIDWETGSFQIGYWLRSAAWGRGLATEATRLLALEAFGRLAAKRVSLWMEAENTRSIQVAIRLGFDLEQRLACERRNALGDWQDTLVYTRSSASGL